MISGIKILDLYVPLLPALEFLVELEYLVCEFGKLGESLEAIELKLEEIELWVHELGVIAEDHGHIWYFKLHLVLF